MKHLTLFALCVLVGSAAHAGSIRVTNTSAIQTHAAVAAIKADPAYSGMTNQLAQYDGHVAAETNQLAQYDTHYGQSTNLDAAAIGANTNLTGATKTSAQAMQQEIDKIYQMLNDLDTAVHKNQLAADDVHDAVQKLSKVLINSVAVQQ